jgi:hypothetical protein
MLKDLLLKIFGNEYVFYYKTHTQKDGSYTTK